jgi:16S rRNA (uracil1498-N3)-methyltransferase
MHRFYISPENWNADALILTGSEAHHARHVLRMKRSDKAVLFNGQGREITAEITHLSGDEIRLRKLRERETPPSRCRITLAQAIPKGKNMELIVQKAVELGAAEIAPLISERTIIQLHGTAAGRKQAKWQQVAIEAAKQCGQNWLPYVRPPQELKEFFDALEPGVSPANPVAGVYDRRRASVGTTDHREAASFSAYKGPLPQLQLIGSLQPDAQHLKKVLADYTSGHSAPPAHVIIIIGPEGDLTPHELALARSHGCIPITFGPIVLRVETAAIYCLSILSYELTGE